MLLASLLAFAAATAQGPAPSESPIEAAGPTGPLRGTYAGPVGAKVPVVLIIPGSGPTDRDGNNPLGVKGAPYRLLAEGLAASGIASVRIDKRGMFGSAAAVPDPNAVTIDDYVHDTGAWITAIRARTGATCVWVLGHSEGGLVALASVARAPEHVCGLITVSTAGRPLADVLKAQLRANPANAPLLYVAEGAIDTLVQGKPVDAGALPAPLLPLFAPQVQHFLMNILPLDPAKLIPQVRLPTLILQGKRDVQVSVEDAERLKAAQPAATLVLLDDTNHILKRITLDSRAANIASYGDPTLPLAPGVLDAIATFVHAHPVLSH